MYNLDLKHGFIREYTTSLATAENCSSVFNSVEKFETEHDTDFSQMSAEQRNEVVNSVAGIRSHSREVKIIILKKYCAYCVRKGVESATEFEYSDSGIEKLRKTWFRGPAHLQSEMDIMFYPESEKGTDNMYRAYIWLAFSGLREPDMFELTKDNFDFDDMSIRHNGFEYPIYRQSVQCFKNCIELDAFKYIHPLYGSDKEVWKSRSPGPGLFRGVRGTVDYLRIREELTRRQGKRSTFPRPNMRITFNSAHISGIFYSMYEREMAGLPVDFSYAADLMMFGKEYSDNPEIGYNRESRRREIMTDYLKDYNRWKLVCNL